MSTPTVRWAWYGGLAIAVLGFVITWQFVAQTISPDLCPVGCDRSNSWGDDRLTSLSPRVD